jgi:hypothetical protein
MLPTTLAGMPWRDEFDLSFGGESGRAGIRDSLPVLRDAGSYRLGLGLAARANPKRGSTRAGLVLRVA